MQLPMNGDKKIFEKTLTDKEIEEIENALEYNCSSSVGYAEKKLKPIIQFFKNDNVNLKVEKSGITLIFNNMQSFQKWLKEEKFEYTFNELKNTNLS